MQAAFHLCLYVLLICLPLALQQEAVCAKETLQTALFAFEEQKGCFLYKLAQFATISTTQKLLKHTIQKERKQIESEVEIFFLSGIKL